MEGGTMLMSLAAQAPAAVAVIIVVIRFLHFLKCERTSRAETLTQRHHEFFAELEKGRRLAEDVKKVVVQNTEQFTRTAVALEHTAGVLGKLNGVQSETGK